MSDRDNKRKELAGEILPEPQHSDGTVPPRRRIVAHLSRVLAAAAGLTWTAALADVTPPGGDKKPSDADKNKPAPPKNDKAPDTPRGYEVVDPIPDPPPAAGKPGFLKLDSKPRGAAIQLDGRDLGLKTPQKKIKIAPGVHTITLTSPDKETTESFSVEIEAGKTQTQTYELQPKAPEKKQ